jgi:hypothetical protein
MMKRFIAALFVMASLPLALFAKEKNAKSYYEATVYHFATDKQGSLIDGYLENSFLPALHQLGLKAGVFRPIANDTAKDKTVFVLVEHPTFQSILDTRGKLRALVPTLGSSKDFTGTPYDAPAFNRKEISILEAWPKALKLKEPNLKSPKAEHVYEWRSYESATEDLHVNKVQMFNEGGEVDLFERLNFNAIFYSSVIAGARMPNLVYLTSFENLADRDAHWKTFGDDPFWKKLSSSPEYQHNVSKADIILLKALPYSDY